MHLSLTVINNNSWKPDNLEQSLGSTSVIFAAKKVLGNQ